MMLSKQKLKYVQSLKQHKLRQKYGNFVVEGDKMVREVLEQGRLNIEFILALDTWLATYGDLCRPYAAQTFAVSEADLKQISNLTTPNKVMLVAQKPTVELDMAVVPSTFALYLDGLQDPGNMGTILRIADWFSMPYVFCSPDSVDPWSPKVVQASMGAFLRLNIIETPFEVLKQRFPTWPVLTTVLKGDNIFETEVPAQGLIVIGNEGSGVRPSLIEQADFHLTIPGGGGAESLNAAVATGIVAAVLSQKRR